jgi:RimJ/RimL family protein N-acetyltransferase
VTLTHPDTIVRSDRLDLPILEPAVLDALVTGDRAAIAGLARFDIPEDFPGLGGTPDLPDTLGFIRFRRDQLRSDPARYPWSLRAMVLRAEQRMIGYVNFHGAPGVNDVAAADALELGWTVFPAYRGQGYATEVARTLMDWATRTYGIRRYISATTPDNAASLRVHEKLGFRRTGQIVDGEIIFELRR